MDHHLHVHVVGDGQAAVDGGGGGAPVFVQFQRTGAGVDHFDQRFGAGSVAFA